MEDMESPKLIYQNMRTELIDYLKVIKNSGNNTNGSDFDEAIHFFFDDTPLSRNSEKAIGYFLINQEESSIISELTSLIDNALNEFRNSFNINIHSGSLEWQRVINKAGQVYKTILSAGANK